MYVYVCIYVCMYVYVYRCIDVLHALFVSIIIIWAFEHRRSQFTYMYCIYYIIYFFLLCTKNRWTAINQNKFFIIILFMCILLSAGVSAVVKAKGRVEPCYHARSSIFTSQLSGVVDCYYVIEVLQCLLVYDMLLIRIF